jgi:hypothetical protein
MYVVCACVWHGISLYYVYMMNPLSGVERPRARATRRAHMSICRRVCVHVVCVGGGLGGGRLHARDVSGETTEPCARGSPGRVCARVPVPEGRSALNLHGYNSLGGDVVVEKLILSVGWGRVVRGGRGRSSVLSLSLFSVAVVFRCY